MQRAPNGHPTARRRSSSRRMAKAARPHPGSGGRARRRLARSGSAHRGSRWRRERRERTPSLEVAWHSGPSDRSVGPARQRRRSAALRPEASASRATKEADGRWLSSQSRWTCRSPAETFPPDVSGRIVTARVNRRPSGGARSTSSCRPRRRGAAQPPPPRPRRRVEAPRRGLSRPAASRRRAGRTGPARCSARPPGGGRRA